MTGPRPPIGSENTNGSGGERTPAALPDTPERPAGRRKPRRSAPNVLPCERCPHCQALHPAKLYLSIPEAAGYLGWATSTIYSRRSKNLMPRGYRLGRSVRFRSCDLAGLLEQERP